MSKGYQSIITAKLRCIGGDKEIRRCRRPAASVRMPGFYFLLWHLQAAQETEHLDFPHRYPGRRETPHPATRKQPKSGAL